MELPSIKDLFAGWRKKPPVPFSVLFKKFKSILERNNSILELIGDMGDKLGGDYVFDRQYIFDSCERLGDQVFKLVSDLSLLCQRKNVSLFTAFERVQHQIREELAGRRALSRSDHILPLAELTHDLADEGGNKMASLGDIRNILGCTVPEGFVVTAGAYFEAMERAGLRKLAAQTTKHLCDTRGQGLEEASLRLRQSILSMPLPRSLSKAVEQAARKLAGEGGALLAVRSSAWGEDGESSFAGMYESVLGVAPADILDAYRRVLASLFCEDALRYRMHHDTTCEEPAMAVGVMRMVDARTSGGLYTYAPLQEHDQPMVVSAAWGLGKPIVDGTAETDTYFLRREPPHETISSEVSPKTTRLGLDPSGGTRTESVPAELRDNACLDRGQLALLAETAMNLERFFKRPLDVEWAFTPDGTLTVLQARPLSIRPRSCSLGEDVAEAAKDAPVIFSGKGVTAMGGVASGRVHIVDNDPDLADFPYGGILVARHSSPRYARIMPKCRGIIADVGSATGHMATIARELRVPTLVGAGNATRVLRQGQEITLDADHKVVYDGAVEALCRYELSKEDVFEESWEYRTLKRVLRHISPLTLLDPKSDQFRPESCKTFHDIARYVHQRAVDKLISLAETHQDLTEGAPRRLATKLPLGMTIIDVDGGLAPGEGDEVGEDAVRCRPLSAILDGMNAAGMWETRPVPVDLGSFMSSVTRTFSADQSHPTRMGRNLAVVSREYLNLHLRLGYHFTVVDAYLGGSINDNVIFFRFMGGVTDFTRRSRRATLVADILEQFDFVVETAGDMVTGRVKKHPTRAMLDKMFMLGGLIGYTRQLDAMLDSDEAGQRHVQEFLQRISALREARE
ncbi:PEP/pyruvate-binding domain-containing protein [Fundidesulfovibrio terrae]|uniref:PEP/pyruvate-binding domain-containing protein n=1 Tax=Fundidesulfovibrio terrae TaxID=2922866 RepID=UPI001FB0073E|nr:PEP/pyruvate-binding domain-containing protein [Fundidesulfovibrio terrae]